MIRKFLITILLMFSFTNNAQALFGVGDIVHDPAAEVTRLIQVAEQFIEKITLIEKLDNIRGTTELLEFINLAELENIRKHIPDSFLDILSAVSQVDGGRLSIERLLEALGNASEDADYSEDDVLNDLYLYQLENLKKSKGFAAAQTEASQKKISQLRETSQKIDGLELQKDRDAANAKLTAEVAIGQQELIQTNAQILDHMTDQQAEDFLLQQQRYERLQGGTEWK